MFHRMLEVGVALGVVAAVPPSFVAGKPPAYNRGGHLVAVHQSIDIPTTDEVVVRRTYPKDQYDENGKIRRLTPEEYKAAKGNPSLPGYKADTTDLKKGQVLKLTLLKKKEYKSSSSDKDADKPPRVDWVPAGTMRVMMEDYQDSTKTLTVGVDTAAMSNYRNKPAAGDKKGKDKDKIVLDDYKVKMIEILTQDTPDDKKDGKKK